MPPGKRLRVATLISRALKRYVDAHPDETLARHPGVYTYTWVSELSTEKHLASDPEVYDPAEASELSAENTLPRSVPGPLGHDPVPELDNINMLFELESNLPKD
jgi:hypothetical protein